MAKARRRSVIAAAGDGRTPLICITRHLTPATNLVLFRTTLNRPASTFSRSRGRRIFSPNSRWRRGRIVRRVFGNTSDGIGRMVCRKNENVPP